MIRNRKKNSALRLDVHKNCGSINKAGINTISRSKRAINSKNNKDYFMSVNQKRREQNIYVKFEFPIISQELFSGSNEKPIYLFDLMGNLLLSSDVNSLVNLNIGTLSSDGTSISILQKSDTERQQMFLLSNKINNNAPCDFTKINIITTLNSAQISDNANCLSFTELNASDLNSTNYMVCLLYTSPSPRD